MFSAHFLNSLFVIAVLVLKNCSFWKPRELAVLCGNCNVHSVILAEKNVSVGTEILQWGQMLCEQQVVSANRKKDFRVFDAVDYLSSGNFRFERF